MSSLNKKNFDSTVSKFSIAVFVMICLLIKCSCAELKKLNNKLNTLSGGRRHFNSLLEVHENKKADNHGENTESSFLELNTIVKEGSESKLNLKQNVNNPSPNTTPLTPSTPSNASTPPNALTPSNPSNPSTPSVTAGNTNPQQGQTGNPNAVQLQDPKDQFAFANTKVKCAQTNCSFPNMCVAEFVCKCGPGFANYFENSADQQNPNQYCPYGRKKQLISFLLEFFLPPSGHFYAGQYLIAVLKLLLPCALGLMLVFIENALVKGISGVGICGMSIWWLVDVILYGMNKYPDQNNVPLASW